MSEISPLEIVSISTLYGRYQTPFKIGGSVGSYSILRERIKSVVPLPNVQRTSLPLSAVDFNYSEIAVVYIPNAIVTKTGAVIVDDRFVLQESLEGSLENNGIDANLANLAQCPSSADVILNCNKYGMWNYSLFLLEVAPSILLSSFVPGLGDLGTRVFFPHFMSDVDIKNREFVFRTLGISGSRVAESSLDLCRYKGVVLFKLNDPHRSQRLSQVTTLVSSALTQRCSTDFDGGPKRIYISRQAASSRQVENFDELDSKVLKKHDITSLQLEGLTVSDQINLFSKADLVVAEHGAGLANIGFMRPGGFVIEITPEPIAGRAVYRYAASHSHLNYFFGTIPVAQGWKWDKDPVFADLDIYRYLLART